MKVIFDIFWVFFKLGLFTFGGGYAMIPHLKEQVIEKKKWLDEEEVVSMLAIAESTPGPIAINMATYIGYKRKGFWGSLAATLGVILPSFIIIFLISLFFDSVLENKYVQYAFTGIKCGVAFLIFKTGVEMIVKMKKNIFNIVLLCVSGVALIVLEIFAVNVSSIFFILFGAVVGIIVHSIVSHKKNKDKQVEAQLEEQDKEEVQKWYTLLCF